MLLRCPKCQANLNVPETLIGKSIRCPKCQQVFPVSTLFATTPPEPQELAPTMETQPAESFGQPFGLNLPGSTHEDRFVVNLRRGRRWSWAFVGFALSGVFALMVLTAGILGPIHFQNAFFSILAGILASGLIIALILVRLFRAGYFPSSVATSWKFHVTSLLTILGVGVASGLTFYLGKNWGEHASQIQIILFVSLFCSVSGSAFGWYLAKIIQDV